MDLLQLRYFCDAAETQNLSKTAKKFFVPTSNISQTIKRLERELGKELFEHRKNKIILNEDGKLFYDYTSKALNLLENGKKHLADSGEEVCGNISLLCIGNRTITNNALKKFTKLYPNVTFTIRHQNTLTFDYDILISSTFPEEHDKKILLAEDVFSIAISKNHPLASNPNLSVSDLKDQPFIVMQKEHHQYNATIQACTAEGFYPNVAIQTDGTAFLRQYIQLGLGVAIVPYSWRINFAKDFIFTKIPNLHRKIYAFLPKNKHVKKTTRLFLQYLIDEAKNFPSPND
jgi:DNA-binding transcriptional LysR family regulator